MKPETFETAVFGEGCVGAGEVFCFYVLPVPLVNLDYPGEVILFVFSFYRFLS